MRKVGLVLAISALAAMPMMAQSIDFNIMGAGARAHGMGGAFIAVSDDATAIGWNPAGIAQLDKMEASVNGLFNIKKYTYEVTSPYGSYDGDNSISHFAPSFASLILPVKAADRNLVLGVAYQRLIDMGYADSDTGHYSTTVTWEEKSERTGGIDAISPAIALQITPKFMVGAAGNIFVNGTDYEYNLTYSDGDYYTAKEQYSYSGFNINAGVLAVMDKFNIGASMRLPFTLTESGERQRTSSYYTPTTFDTTYPDVEISMPMMIGFGIALKPTDNLTLSADFETRKYSNSEVTEMVGIYDTLGNVIGTREETSELNWLDVNQFRVGMEYLFVGPNAVFPVRLGFRTDPKLVNGTYGTGTDTTQAIGKVFTGGFGMKFGNIWLDLTYEYGNTVWTDVEVAGFTMKENEITHNILASCIVHF